MNTITLTNALSLSMFDIDTVEHLLIKRLTLDEVKDLLNKCDYFKSAIGHQETANVLTALLGVQVEFKRVKARIGRLTLDNQEALIVCQYIGERLPEGCTELPKDARFEYFLVYQC